MKSSDSKFPKSIEKRFSRMLLILGLGIVLMSGYGLNYVRNMMFENYAEKLTKDALSIQNGVDLWLEDRLSVVDLYHGIISNLTLEDLNYTQVENKYLKIDYKKSQIDALYIGLEDGTFLTGKNWVPEASYDPRVRPWYVGVDQGTAAYIGDTYIDIDTKKTIFTVSKAFKTKNGGSGVIAVDLFMETVSEKLDQIISGTDFLTAIIDNQGIVLYYSGDEFLKGQSIESFENNKLFMLYKKYKAHQSVGRLFEINQTNLTMIDTIDKTPWTLIVFTNDENTMNSVEANIQQYVMFNVLGVIIMLVFLLFMDRAIKNIDRQNLEQGLVRPEIDQLTKVFSRSYFDEKLEVFWEMAQKEKVSLGLVLVDVDHFRKYTQAYGQSAADQLLVKLSREIMKSIDPRYVLARYGGNVFTIICYQSDLEDVSKIAEEILVKINSLNIPQEKAPEGVVTISIGVASAVPMDGLSIGQFIHMGFSGLMAAKNSGRNTYKAYL